MNPSISITSSTPHGIATGIVSAANEFWDSGLYWDSGLFWDSADYRGLPSLGVSNFTPSIAVT